jgi:hypothetical protein
MSAHPAYDALLDSVMGAITDPKPMETYSTPEQIALAALPRDSGGAL